MLHRKYRVSDGHTYKFYQLHCILLLNVNVFCFIWLQGAPLVKPSKSSEGQFAKPYRLHQLALPKTYVTRRGMKCGRRKDGRRKSGGGVKGRRMGEKENKKKNREQEELRQKKTN